MATIEFSTLDNGMLIVTLAGSLDMEGTLAVEDPFAFNVATHEHGVVVDLSGVDFMSSIGIRLLMSNAKALHVKGGAMALLAPRVLVRDVLEHTGTHLVIPIYGDRDAAIAALADKG